MSETDLLRQINDLTAQVAFLRNKVNTLSQQTTNRIATSPSLTVLSYLPTALKNILRWGFNWVGNQVDVKAAANEAILVNSSGVAVLKKPDKGLASDSAGLYVVLKTAGGLLVDLNGLYVDWSLAPIQAPIAMIATQVDATTATLADLTELALDVEAGKNYRFNARLYVNADLTGGCNVSVSGTATATAIIYQVLAYDPAVMGFAICDRKVVLDDPGAAQTGAENPYIEITGEIEVNTAGTIVPQFAQAVANGSSSVLVGSHFWVQEINP